MSAATRMKLHYSPKLGRFVRCVAEYECEYGDAHTTPHQLAEAGGAKLSLYGHSTIQTVSPVVDGKYFVGTKDWGRVYSEDGEPVPPSEARAWWKKIADSEKAEKKATTEADDQAVSAPTPTPHNRLARPAIGIASRHKEFELAESSSDAGVLAMLAGSSDPAVRLVVIRNPAVATSTLEQLTMSQDRGWKVYRLAALEELGHRYQDERDERELEIDRLMKADGSLKKLALKAPAAAVLAAMPEPAFQRKPPSARRSLIRRAVDQLGRMLKVSVRVAGWTHSLVWKVAVGSDGVKMISLPRRVARDLSRKGVLGFLVEMFVSVAERPFSSKSLSKQLGFGW
ncbi:hypothetical protein AB0E56_03195 [Microbacterium sp. NPDC028030]|uniref:hypothetical protein n=1 Tax=Microbacterium sp. NPDC028030 TaxID=3155124 RepID=UPI0033EB053B